MLNYVGACYKRDVIDQRIVNETNTGTYTYLGSNGSTGGFIDTPNDVGGWPTYVSTDKLTDTDNDGMPDVWETANGLNPNDATDAATKTLDAKGYYTNIEVYANSLVEDLVKAQNADATEAIEEYYPNVTKAEGIQYYDANVTAEGGYETDTAEGEAGNIMWEMKSDLNAQLSDEASKATEASAATYGTNLVLTGRGTYNNVRFARFQAQTIQTAAADDNAVVFSITPKTGFKFKATNIQFTACKVGTDNGNFDAKWIDAGGTIALYNNESPNRNNSDGGYFSAYNKDVSALSTSSEEACQLKLNIYNVGATNSDGTINKKEMGLANVVVKGLMIDDTAGISTPVSFGTPVATEYFTIDGRRLQQPQHGVNIQVARMANGKKVTTKVIK